MAVRSPQDIFARHVSSSRGYPLWTPEPSNQLLSHRPEGLRIGDVGVVVPENGNFDVFFNLCLPKDHDFHKASGVPDGFDPIQLGDADIRTAAGAESAGQVLASSSVTSVGRDEASGPTGPTAYAFSLSSGEGALLVLPDGADRHDARNHSPFFEQASRHAAAWYRFAREDLGRIVGHDSIYVITGFHKARSWGLAGYQNEPGEGDIPARFVVGPRGGEGATTKSRWETTRNVEWRVGPVDSLGPSNQSVFVRGFKIALRSSVQGDIRRDVSETPNVSTEGRHSGDSAGVRVEIRRVPEILPVFHPSDIINQYILDREPSARIAITHDNDWGSILDKSLLKPEELALDKLLAKVVSERYTIVLQDGVAHLESKSVSNPVDGTTVRPVPEVTGQLPADKLHRSNGVKGENTAGSLSVVSESNYRCIDESALGSVDSASCSVDFRSFASKFTVTLDKNTPASPESRRLVKIIVISDYVCGFCYICDKILHNAIEACRDLPLRFDVEFRPFVLLNASILSRFDPKQVLYRNAYLVKKLGKEKAELRHKAADEFAHKVGLELTEDCIVCGTTQAHRLSVKAYLDGGQNLQKKLSTYIFDGCLSSGKNISDEAFLVDAAVSSGLMNKEEAIDFLHSEKYLDCVEKMVNAARAQGINGVPFVIIDGKWGVSGLQPVECFIQIFRKLAQSSAPPTLRKAANEQARAHQ